MPSWAFSRCSVATCPSVRPMPVLSLSTSSCIATIPISAKASRPIHRRPRISLSSKALLERPSRASTPRSAMPGVAPAEARLVAGADAYARVSRSRRTLTRQRDTRRRDRDRGGQRARASAERAGPDIRLARRGATRRLTGSDRSGAPRLKRAGRSGRGHASPPGSLEGPASFMAARRRAEEARGLRAVSAAEGTIAPRVSSAASGSRPQPQTGSRAGRCSLERARRGSA